MTVISRVCSGKNTAKNPCKKMQNVALGAEGYFLATKDQFFASEAEATLANARTDIGAKKLQIGYPVNSFEESSENGVTQSATGDYRSALTQQRIIANHRLNKKQADVLKSWENAYTHVYFYTQDGFLDCHVQTDGKIKGIPLLSSLVDVIPLTGGENLCKINFQINPQTAVSEIKPDFALRELEGIYDLEFNVLSETDSEVKFTAKACCGDVSNLAQEEIVVMDATNGAVALTGFTYANGVYTITSDGAFEGDGGYLATAGVIDKTEFFIEGKVLLNIE